MPLQLESIKSEVQDEQSSVAVYRIVSYPADYTLKGLHEKWQDNEIIIPQFQRRFVWTHTKASQLIESFLLGLPVPGVFLYKEPTEKFLVIDGQQRLRTVFSFFEGKLPNGNQFFLKDVVPRWEGKSYEELDDTDSRRLRDSVLRAILVEQIDPKDNTSLYHIFNRLNTGGTALTTQEVRNCIYHGPFNDAIMALNRDRSWRNIVGSVQTDGRMRDVELILRFLSLFENQANYSKPMKEFISSFMKAHQWSKDTMALQESFRAAARRIVEALGPRPFHIRRGLNAAVFDSVMLAFARHQSVPRDIEHRWSALLNMQAYLEAVTSGTTDVDTVRARISLANQTLFM